MTDDQHPADPERPETDVDQDPADGPYAAALAGRLHRAADAISPGRVSRGAVDARIAARTRTRQLGRVGVAAAAAVILVGGVTLAGVGSPGDTEVSTGDAPAATTSPEAKDTECYIPPILTIEEPPDGPQDCLPDACFPGAPRPEMPAPVFRPEVLDLLAAVGPDTDSGMSPGLALFLQHAERAELSPVEERFVDTLRSLYAAEDGRWAESDNWIDDVRRRGEAALTADQRDAVATYEATLPSAAEAEALGPDCRFGTGTTSTDAAPSTTGATTSAPEVPVATTSLATPSTDVPPSPTVVPAIPADLSSPVPPFPTKLPSVPAQPSITATTVPG